MLGTGAASRRPAFAGLDLPGVHLLDDRFKVKRHLSEPGAGSAVVVGGGYIGLEMADALVRRGLEVTLLEYAPAVLTTVNPRLGDRVGEELARNGVTVRTGVAVERIERDGRALRVVGAPDFAVTGEMVLVPVGAHPATKLAGSAGVPTGRWGAMITDRRMATGVPGVPGVWASGDCVETCHRLLKRNLYLPLGSTAHKQGRVAGENAAGGDRTYEGTLGTQVVKVFDLAIARTGLRAEEASQAGFAATKAEFEAWDHKVYYPGAHILVFRVTGDRESGRLLGAQNFA